MQTKDIGRMQNKKRANRLWKPLRQHRGGRTRNPPALRKKGLETQLLDLNAAPFFTFFLKNQSFLTFKEDKEHIMTCRVKT
jgi:hypothetical protein